MWTAVVILGLVGLLAWKAPRAFRWLLAIAGGLVLLALLVGGGLWLRHAYTQSTLAEKFDADPESKGIPPALYVYVARESYGARWAVFNASPDTAFECHARGALFNSAGVKLSAEPSTQRTFEPLQSNVTYHSAERDSRLQLAGCVAQVRGKATVNAIRALISSPDFQALPLRVRLNVLRKAVAETPPADDEWVDLPTAHDERLSEPGDSDEELFVKDLMAVYIEQAIRAGTRTSKERTLNVDGQILRFSADSSDAEIVKAVWDWLNDRAPWLTDPLA